MGIFLGNDTGNNHVCWLYIYGLRVSQPQATNSTLSEFGRAHESIARGVYANNFVHIGSCNNCINTFPIIHMLQVLLFSDEDTDEGDTSMYDTAYNAL